MFLKNRLWNGRVKKKSKKKKGNRNNERKSNVRNSFPKGERIAAKKQWYTLTDNRIEQEKQKCLK